ncbi:MAG TPA: GAF domain-containing protein [Candidatus Methylomirabilis sp.]|nr:GAF domain-containing protein [Candidatus Methylomirabilis sp.]
MTRSFRLYHRTSFRTKFALHAVLSTVLVFALLLPLVLYIQTQVLLGEVENHGFQVAKVFAHSSVQAVVADDYLVLQHIVDGLSSQKKVLNAMVLKEDGTVLVHSVPNERGKQYQDASSLLAAGTQAPLLQRYETANGTPVYDFAVPVYVLDQKQATARVGISIEGELQEIRRTRNYIILLGVVVLAIGLAWATYQARRLTRPIQELVRGTQEIAKGRLDHRISVPSGDELGELAEAFNKMTEAVQAMVETSRSLSSTLDADAVLQSIASYALTLVKADVAFIAPFERTVKAATVKVALGARSDGLLNARVGPGQGMGGLVLATGEPFVTADYLNDPRFLHDPVYDELARREGIVSTVAVPITLRGEVVGLLWVAHRTAKPFTQEDVDALQRMAHQAAIAMENARLFAETKLKTARLEALVRVSQAITSTLDSQRIIHAILQAMGELMEGSVVRLWELRDEAMVLVGSYGVGNAEGEIRRIPIGEGVVGRVVASRIPIAVEDLRIDPRFINPKLVQREGLVSLLTLPLLREEKVWGTLAILTRTPHHFTQDEIDLFASFAQQAAIALENARLYQDLQRSHQELLAAQTELVRKTRMATMGEVAAMVAHETRNPLGALSNCVQLLWANPHITGEDAELLDIIQGETRRLNQIVSDFLAFGRPREPHFQEVDLHELINEAFALLQRDDRCSSSNIFRRQFDASLQKVWADRDQLRQVLWNLFLNAVQAMKESGTLQVETRNTTSGVEILVQDTGPGIPRTVLSNIFEPFYSTKPGGTGLGLAIVQRIVEEHGARITVESQAGAGTCFLIALKRQ